MAIKSPDRYQMTALPAAVEDYVSPDDPVRAYDAMIDAMDLEELGIFKEWKKVGNSPYDPTCMLKLMVYGYSYGWRSSRKLERALYHNLSFIWLMGGLRPDHKTISNFRKNHKKSLRKVLKQSVRICIELDLIEGNHLFLDGSKIRGNASINQTRSKKKWEEKLSEIEKRIDAIIEESEKIDQEESGSLVKMTDELKDAQKLQNKIKSILDKAEAEKLDKINSTDTDAVNYKSRQGSHSGYNAQIVTDEKNGLIVSADVVNENNDANQFSNQIDQANENLDKNCQTAVSDAGFFNVNDIKKITDQEIDVIVPSQKQVLKHPKEEPFGKDKFKYDPSNNEYICPMGKALYYSYFSKAKRQHKYRMKREADCLECRHFGTCTTSKRGRTISRLENEELKEQLGSLYESDEGQELYKKRKEKVELPFGHFKRTLNGGAFLVRGLEAVKGEFSIFANCFNIARMITLLGGVPQMVKVLQARG